MPQSCAQRNGIRTRVQSIAFGALLVLATTDARADEEPNGVYVEAPLADGALRSHEASPLPTMQQSLWLSTDLFEGAHFGLGKILDPYDRTWWKGMFGR